MISRSFSYRRQCSTTILYSQQLSSYYSSLSVLQPFSIFIVWHLGRQTIIATSLQLRINVLIKASCEHQPSLVRVVRLPCQFFHGGQYSSLLVNFVDMYIMKSIKTLNRSHLQRSGSDWLRDFLHNNSFLHNNVFVFWESARKKGSQIYGMD